MMYSYALPDNRHAVVLCFAAADEIVRTVGEGTFGKVTECKDLQKSVFYLYVHILLLIFGSAGARELEAPPGATQRPLSPEPPPSRGHSQGPHSYIWAPNTTVRPRV